MDLKIVIFLTVIAVTAAFERKLITRIYPNTTRVHIYTHTTLHHIHTYSSREADMQVVAHTVDTNALRHALACT